MAKTKTHYVCQACGRTAAKPLGKCPQCGEWESYAEELMPGEVESSARRVALNGSAPKPRPIAQVEGGGDERIPLSIGEFARVLGGGIVPGSLVLVGGDPGIGKSTLMLQTAMEMAASGPVLYVSGEESPGQIKSPSGCTRCRIT